MKLILVLALVCVAIVSQASAFEMVKNFAIALRWPSATATCPPGKVLLGGGGACKSLGLVGWTLVKESFPSNEREWTVSCYTPKVQNVMAEVWAVCI